MMYIYVLVMVLFLVGTEIIAIGQEQQANITLRKIGRVTIRTMNGNQGLDVSDRQEPALLVMQTSTDKELLRVDFPGLEDIPVDLRFLLVSVYGFSDPLIVASATDPGVSDSRHETAIIGFIDGKPKDLIGTHLQTNRLPDEGAICLGYFGTSKTLGILRINFIWGDDEFHVSPHHYEVNRYDLIGYYFKLVNRRITRGVYRHWRQAIHELGYDCRYNFVETISPRGF